ncbi:MAG: hypothetical protein RSC28_03495 [Bacteroidales bacterium]
MKRENYSELDRFGITMGYTRLGFKMIGDNFRINLLIRYDF